ncbi:MAG: NCS2 family permease [Rhodomicrobiaceae bacterium]
MRQDSWTEFVAGLTVFFTMAYAPFVNALVLGDPKVGMPEGPVFYATCLAAAIGSALCGWYAKTPTALAPGMAFNAFIAQYMKQSALTWPEVLAVCFFVGLALLLMSQSGFRRKVIEAIPRPIKIAVIGGIGALLAELAISIVFPHEQQNSALHSVQHSDKMTYLFVFGVVVILLLNVTLRNYAKKFEAEKRPGLARTLDLLGRSGLLISVIAVAAGFHLLGIEAATVPADTCFWPWTCQPGSLSKIGGLSGHLLAAIPLAIFIIYMLFADIAGSPYHLLPSDEPDRDAKIDRSYIVDSAMNMIAPILGTTPVVFYAENNAGKLVGAKSGATASWVAACFLLLAGVGALFSYLGKPLFELIPQIAVAPALFAVGLFVIASSFSNAEIWPEPGVSEEQEGSTESFLPAAVSIILTPVGLEYGLAGGLLAYYFYFILVPQAAQPAHQKVDPRLHIFAFIAFFAILVKLGITAS